MNEKPTGEWTWESVGEYFIGSEPLDRGACQQIADAHNAALAAERERYEKLRMETTSQVIGQSKKGNDPAANRDSDSFSDSRTVIKSYSPEAFMELQAQLAAEREKVKAAEAAVFAARMLDERQIAEAITIERKKRNELCAAYEREEMEYKKQLATAVKALRQIATVEANKPDEVAAGFKQTQSYEIAAAALAKTCPGKL